MAIEADIWKAINDRNTRFRYQDGFAQREIPAYQEDSIREALVNAVAHRDYTIVGRSIVIKASPEEFFIENPGSFMPGVNLENILDRSVWRNRLLSEALEKVHFMERSSQGVDKIFLQTIEAGKGIPIFVETKEPTISLSIPSTLKDQNFINFLENIATKRQVTLSVKEIIELEKIREHGAMRALDLRYKDSLLEKSVIEPVGVGRGTKYMLSHQYYQYNDQSGLYTRLKGLSVDVKRTLILEHLKQNKTVTHSQLQIAMPDMDQKEISRLLRSMKKADLIEHVGPRKAGFWRLIERKTKDFKSV